MTFGRSGAQDWAPERPNVKIKNGEFDQYGAGPFEQQQFGTAGVEGVKVMQNRPERYVLRCVPPSVSSENLPQPSEQAYFNKAVVTREI